MILAALCATQLWGQSQFTGREWVTLGTAVKLQLIRGVIEEAKKNNVILRLSAEYYVKELDATIENAIRNHDALGASTSLGIMLHTIAAMEGDWDNGEGELEHAKKWLGPEHFESFKNAYPQKYARLLSRRKSGDIWKFFGYTQNERIYYDSASINYLPGDLVKIWIKREYIDREAGLNTLKTQGSYKPAYEDYSHTLNLYQIDCPENTFAILTSYIYKKDGSLIDAFDHPERIVDIPANSVVNRLAKDVCAEFKKKAE
jgi:hypothetical protein